MEDGPEGPPSKMEPRPNGPGQCLEGVSDSSFRVAKKKPGGGGVMLKVSTHPTLDLYPL